MERIINIYITPLAKSYLEDILLRTSEQSPMLGLSFGAKKIIDKNTGTELEKKEGWFINVFNSNNIGPGPILVCDGINIKLISSHLIDTNEIKTLDYIDGDIFLKK